MKLIFSAMTLSWLLGLLVVKLFMASAVAQTREEGPWWPNTQWGAEDQAGASNWITADKVLEAVSLVKTGKMYELGFQYERGMPLIGQRSYNLFIPSFPTAGPYGKNNLVFNDEFLASEIGQVGTQFDGLGHPGQRLMMANGQQSDVFYNGYNGEDMAHPYGLLKLGVENVKPIVTRGIVIDIADLKNVKTLPAGFETTLADVKAALIKQGISEQSIKPGDAILFNFGWWRHWPKQMVVDASQPHISPDVVKWLIHKKPVLVGSDSNLDGGDFPVHSELVTKNGIFNLEYMTFESILADQVNEFLFICTPLRLKGATGSPVRPIAIH